MLHFFLSSFREMFEFPIVINLTFREYYEPIVKLIHLSFDFIPLDIFSWFMKPLTIFKQVSILCIQINLVIIVYQAKQVGESLLIHQSCANRNQLCNFLLKSKKKTNLETFILMQFDCQRFESDQTFLSVKCNYFKFWDFIGQRNVQNAFKH